MRLRVGREEGQEILNHYNRRNIKEHIIQLDEKMEKKKKSAMLDSSQGAMKHPRHHITVLPLFHTTRPGHRSRHWKFVSHGKIGLKFV